MTASIEKTPRRPRSSEAPEKSAEKRARALGKGLIYESAPRGKVSWGVLTHPTRRSARGLYEREGPEEAKITRTPRRGNENAWSRAYQAHPWPLHLLFPIWIAGGV